MRFPFVVAAAIVLVACSHTASPVPAASPTPELPTAFNAEPLPTASAVITVMHDASSDTDLVAINGEPVTATRVAGTLEAMKHDPYAPAAVTIDAAWNAEYGTVLNVCFNAVFAGYTELGLANRVVGSAADSSAMPGFEKEVRHGHTVFDSQNHGKLHPISVLVNQTNTVWIDDARLPSTDLYRDMRNAVAMHRANAARGFTTRISIIADQRADWGTIITILDAGRRAGDDDVGFVAN